MNVKAERLSRGSGFKHGLSDVIRRLQCWIEGNAGAKRGETGRHSISQILNHILPQTASGEPERPPKAVRKRSLTSFFYGSFGFKFLSSFQEVVPWLPNPFMSITLLFLEHLFIGGVSGFKDKFLIFG